MHVTIVELAVWTAHVLLSINMVYNEISDAKLEPEKLMVSPPTTVPNRGDIDWSSGVKVDWYVMLLVSDAPTGMPASTTYAWHEY